jgi:hypothetical protein
VPNVTDGCGHRGNGSVLPTVDVRVQTDVKGVEVNESGRQEIRIGDVIEFSLRGERLTAEAMLITEDGVILLDLFDGDRPAWARLSILDDVAVFRPDASQIVTAA